MANEQDAGGEPMEGEREPLFDIDSLYETPVWDVDSLPGRAGSGLIALLPVVAIIAAGIIGVALWLLEGWTGRVIAGAVIVGWLVFTVGAIWQIREMRASGGYTRFRPTDSWD